MTLTTLRLILILLLWAPALMAQEIVWKFETSQQNFLQTHQALVDLSIELDEQANSQSVYNREGQGPAFLKSFLEEIKAMLGTAYASQGRVCIYGGWASYQDRQGRCNAPWNYSQSDPLLQYGPTYSPNHYCGGDKLFRCNPILFGPGDDGKGRCVEFESNSEISHKCYQASRPHFNQIYSLYRSDPEFRDKYKQLLLLMIGHCRSYRDYQACHALLKTAVEFRNNNCEDDALQALLRENEFDRLVSDWSQIDDELSEMLGEGEQQEDQAPAPSTADNPTGDPERAEHARLVEEIDAARAQQDGTSTTSEVARPDNGGMSPPVLQSGGATSPERGNAGSSAPSPNNWNSYHRPTTHQGPPPEPINWSPVDYTLTDGEAADLIRQGRLETDSDNYNRLDRVAYEAFQSGGQRACQSALNRAYEETQPRPIWQGMSLEDRARQIYRHSEYVANNILENGSRGNSTNDPNQFHPDMSPSAAACITFIETRGTLNPHAMNYTFCQARGSSGGPVSTAHGLGQQTWTTFRNLRRQGLLPLTAAPQYDQLEAREAFHRMNNDVTMQIEVLMRYLNYEVKRAGSLIDGVAAYDQDHQSNYLRLFRNCHNCMGQGPSADRAAECYRAMD